MSKRPVVINLALSGGLKAALSSDSMPDLSDGSCVGMDTNLFFSDRKVDITNAKAICATCPVAQLCASWASRNVEFGVFGGLTASERAKVFGSALKVDPVEVAIELRFILTSTLDAISLKYSVDQRTVLRWRNVLKDYQLAA